VVADQDRCPVQRTVNGAGLLPHALTVCGRCGALAGVVVGACVGPLVPLGFLLSERTRFALVNLDGDLVISGPQRFGRAVNQPCLCGLVTALDDAEAA
jgi:hypothetical protein